MNTIIILLCIMIVVVVSIFATVFKIQKALTESQEKIRSELSEIRKLLERK